MKNTTFKNKLDGAGVFTPESLERGIETYRSQYPQYGIPISVKLMSVPFHIPFESTEEEYRNSGFKKFRVGTCNGLWRATDDAYEVLAVVNTEKGNGNFALTMRYFERSCRRDGKKLRLCEVFNPWLYYTSIKRFGFKRMKGTLFTLEKSFEVK